MRDGVPLCVDLDGTLVRTDLLLESALDVLHREPLLVFALLIWLLHGRAYLKQQIALRANVDVDTLPYDTRVLSLIRAAQPDRQVYLCTAADERLANRVARHVGGFSGVMASDGRRNLSGHAKARELVRRFGKYGFDYAGNEHKDLNIWRHARGAIVVNAARGVADRASKVCDVLQVEPRLSTGITGWLKAFRLHQWLKNLLVFAPLLAAHLILQPGLVGRASAAFVIFGVCASSVYLLNDLLDLRADRIHPRKRNRPFASGVAPISVGLVGIPLLATAAFVGAYFVAPLFALVLLGYYALTLAYSLYLKRIVMVDVLVLAGLYTIRIVAGAAAVGVALSFWLLAFSMFLFLSLALAKRYTEVRGQHREGSGIIAGRGYGRDDYELLVSLGGASGYVSVLVMALYINSTASIVLYHRPQILWLLCPLLLYWISRVWVVAHRGAMHDDPVVFAFSDRVSRIIGILCVAVVLFSALL